MAGQQQSGQGNYNQRYQQYYQQQYAQRYPQQGQSGSDSHRRRILALSVVSVLVLIVAAVFVFDVLKGEDSTEKLLDEIRPRLEQPAEVVPFSITELKFCRSIDENYGCDEPADGTFSKGDTIWMLARAVAFTQKKYGDKYIANISQGITTIGPNNYQIFELTTDHISDLVFDYKEPITTIVIKNQIQTTQKYLTGQYLVSLILTDNLAEGTKKVVTSSTNLFILK